MNVLRLDEDAELAFDNQLYVRPSIDVGMKPIIMMTDKTEGIIKEHQQVDAVTCKWYSHYMIDTLLYSFILGVKLLRNALDQYRNSGSREAELKMNMLLCSFVNQSIQSVRQLFNTYHEGSNDHDALICDPYNPTILNGISMRFVTDYREASAADVEVVHDRVLKELVGQQRVMECKLQGVHCRTVMCVVECLTMWIACTMDGSGGKRDCYLSFSLLDDMNR